MNFKLNPSLLRTGTRQRFHCTSVDSRGTEVLDAKSPVPVANVRRCAKVPLCGVYLVSLLFLFSLSGCSRGSLGNGSPSLDVDGFFVCQKCSCLSAINGGEPPTKIPVHAAICPQHAWQRISRDDYIRRASAWPIETHLLAPALSLTMSTSHGKIGPIIYHSGLAFRVGSLYYGISARSFIFASSALGLSLIGCVWLWKAALRSIQPAPAGNPR